MTDFRLHRQEQKWYALPDLAASTPAGPVTVPVGGWEASFDDGATWHQALPHPDLPGSVPAWLIRGDQHPGAGDTSPSTGVLVIKRILVTPLVRLQDNPETPVEQAPRISIWG